LAGFHVSRRPDCDRARLIDHDRRFARPDGFDLLPAMLQQLFVAISSFNFLAIPLFAFTGGILAEGGIAKILMDLATITIGRGRGGMGTSIVASTMICHGILGSSSADAAAIGKVTLPTFAGAGLPAAVQHRPARNRRGYRHADPADQ
jgi:TRAP-type mannitol/chloroaromatic compound transport system permease large subunit